MMSNYPYSKQLKAPMSFASVDLVAHFKFLNLHHYKDIVDPDVEEHIITLED